MNTSERLEAAILADRDDVELYLVLADELQGNGDPRGELIVMQNQIQQIEERDKRHAMQRRCDEHIAKHDLLGPLKSFGTSVWGKHADVTWRYGFIRCLEIGWGEKCTETPEQATQTLAEILRHPSSPFITMLVLGPAPGRQARGRVMDMQCLIDAIVETGCPKSLRTLHLGKLCDWRLDRTATGNIGEASETLGRLQKLTLEAGTVTIGKLVLPELVELRILTNRLDEAMIDQLTCMKCPKLKTLKISYVTLSPVSEALTARLRSKLDKKVKLTVTRTSREVW